MQQPPTIRNAYTADIEPLVAALSDSFSNDPMLNWVIPSVHLYPDYFRLLIREVYLPRGIIHLDENARAASLWLPPEQRFQMAPRFSLLRLGLRIAAADGLRVFRRLRQQGTVFEKHQPTEPHYYLQFLGCRLAEQGNGFGSALIEHGTRICDERCMPAYLESSNELNVPLYQRHNFKVIGEEQVGRNGPKAWFMWRDPQ